MSASVSAVAEPVRTVLDAPVLADQSMVFRSRDIRNLDPESVGGARFSFLGSCIASCCMWLANVVEGKPLRMTKPDHVLATMAQLKYMNAPCDECVHGLLEQLGLDGEKARFPADGEAVLNAVKSAGDCMYLMLTEDPGDGPRPVPQMVAFVRRGGMTYFFDPAHGLHEYGPLQWHRLRAYFVDHEYDERVFSYWTVRAAPSAHHPI